MTLNASSDKITTHVIRGLRTAVHTFAHTFFRSWNLLEFLIHRFGPLWMSKLQCPVRETPMASLLEVVSCQPHREPLYTSLFSCLAIYQEQSNSGPKEDNISQIDVLNSFIQYLLRACYVLVWILVVKKVIQIKKTMIKGGRTGCFAGPVTG